MKNLIKKVPTSVIYSAICLVVVAIVIMSYVARKTKEVSTQTGSVAAIETGVEATIEFTGGELTGFSS